MDNDSKIQLYIGDIVLATITKILKTHIELSLGNTCAVMPTSEYSWCRSYNLKREFNVGDRVKAVVISMKDSIVMLSIKRMQTDPWKTVYEFYTVGLQVKGIVKRIMKFGAFVELTNGVQGLLRRSYITDDPEVDINTIISLGQKLDVNITSIEKDERKMFFSMVNN